MSKLMNFRPIHFSRKLLALAVVLSLVAAGCGDTSDNTADSATTTSSGSTAPTTVPAKVTTTATVSDGVSEEASKEGADLDLQAFADESVGVGEGGIVVLAVRNGETISAASGSATDDGDAMTIDRVFRIGSISKTYMAVMVMQMVEEGLVDLDAPLSTYLPDTPVGADTPVRKILSHRSGIADYTSTPTFMPTVIGDMTATVTPEEVLGFVADIPLANVDQFVYSNTNYILVGQLIEAVDGTDVSVSLKTRITEPLGLESTLLVGGGAADPAALVGGWSTLASLDGDPDASYEAMASGAWAAGAMVSTAPEVATFFQALVDGRLVKPESLVAMSPAGPGDYGFGLIGAVFSDGTSALSHGGGIPGYLSAAAINPETGDLLVALSNNDLRDPNALLIKISDQW